MASIATDVEKTGSAKPVSRKAATPRSTNAKSAARSRQNPKKSVRRSNGKQRSPSPVPAWVGITASVIAAGVAAGYVAWRHHKNGGNVADDFAAAFSDGETDRENFDQTRNAGPTSMRDDHEDWEDIDDMADASFPASDPPSFNPGTA